MDKDRINHLVGKEVDEKLEQAGVKAKRVVKSFIMPKVSATVDHEHDSLTVTVSERGKTFPLATYIESLRDDVDFVSAFTLAPHPRRAQIPFEVKAGEPLQPGDLESLASGAAVLTGWRNEVTETVELGENEIPASGSGLRSDIEEIASGKKTIRVDV